MHTNEDINHAIRIPIRKMIRPLNDGDRDAHHYHRLQIKRPIHTQNITQNTWNCGHCDVIVLIRYAYGKYAWEASCIFNDCDMVKEIEEVCSSTPNMIDNSPNMIDSASKSESAAGSRNDMMSKALVESQSATYIDKELMDEYEGF
eukprot:1011902_1